MTEALEEGRRLTTSERRAAIGVLTVKVKPPSAVARKSARDLTLRAPMAVGSCVILVSYRSLLGRIAHQKDTACNMPRR